MSDTSCFFSTVPLVSFLKANDFISKNRQIPFDPSVNDNNLK